MNQEIIGKFIKNLRIEKGWTQEELAKKLYITRQMISNIELGKTALSHDKVIMLSKIFSVGIIDIYSGEKINCVDKKETDNVINNIFFTFNSKIKKLVFIFTFIFIVLLTIFGLYYFFNNYNTTKIYEVYGENDYFKTDTGLIILTRDEIYFKINVESNNKTSNAQIDGLNLMFKNGKEDKEIMSVNDNKINFTDFNGYNEYLTYDIINNSEINFYIEVVQDGKPKNRINLNLKKVYENKNIITDKKKNISESTDSDEIKKNEVPYLIEEKFDIQDGNYILKQKENDISIIISYIPDSKIFSVLEEKKNMSEYWEYDISIKNIKYTQFDDHGDIEEKTYNDIYEDKEEIKYFREKYYSKYIKD